MKPEDYTPTVIVRPVGKRYGYDGLIEFNHQRYIVALSCRSPKEAKEKASRVSAELCKHLKKIAGLYLARYPGPQS